LALRYSAKFVEKADYCIGDSVPSTAGLVAWFVSMLKKSRFIDQVRDVWPIALVYDGALKKSSLTYFVLRILEVFLYRKSSKIVSTVPLLAPHLLSSRVSPEKLVYIPNGVDLDVIKFSPRDERFSGPINVTYAGGFGNAHDPLSIIHAAKILGEAGRSLRFDFYGEGIKLRSCIDLASALSLDNVFFHKSVSKADLSRVLSMSDILIAAVTDSDAYQFGLNLNKLYDYLAAGRPVVLAARSKHRVVEDAECGYMVPPESPEKLSEAILTICDLGPGRRIAMGANGRKFAETNYDINQLAVEFERAAFAN
jgi:glycosyltransferase involved in cell wall biosynthesis